MRFTRCRFSPEIHLAGEELEVVVFEAGEVVTVKALAAPTSKTATTPLVADAATSSLSL
jgi:hypothetical protein